MGTQAAQAHKPESLVIDDVEKLKRRLDDLETANRQLQALNASLEQKASQDALELKHKAQELAASNAELQAFAYTAAHDLRAPLRAIQGFATFLGEELALQSTPAARSHLQRIKRGAAQMDSLIQDLLDYSKVASAQVRLLPIKLDRIVHQVIQASQAAIDEKRAVVDVQVDDLSVMGVEVLIVQVLENLLSNALKFVPIGVSPRIVVRAESDDGSVRLWVEDNGIGIPQEYQERIFQVFERLHQQDAYPGTGIGLAIVRKAVERMGGRIGVESEPGKGSRFRVELKRAPTT